MYFSHSLCSDCLLSDGRAKRWVGVSQVQAWTKPSRLKRRAKQHMGRYSPAMRVVRNTANAVFVKVIDAKGS